MDANLASAGPKPAADRSPGFEVIIEPHTGWRAVDFGELYAHRDLLAHMVSKNIKARYVQSVMGPAWAFLQPIATMLIYTVVFSRVARIKVPFEPYALFAFCGILPWTFFSASLLSASSSLIANSQLVSKVYFPRLILPISAVLARTVELGISAIVLVVLMAANRVAPRPEALALVPLGITIAAMTALGLGLWLSVLSLQYRDVAYALGFVIQMMMYLSPVIYASSMIVGAVGPRWGAIWALNPMVGVISAFRDGLLGMHELNGLHLVEAAVVSLGLLITGALYFRRSERRFADVS